MRCLLILFPLLAVACGSQFSSLQEPAEKAAESVGCRDSESRLFDVLYTSLVELKKIPTEKDLQKVFDKALENRPDIHLDREEFLKMVSEFYQILLKIPSKDPNELLEKLTALEVGNQTTLEAQSLQKELREFETKWQSFVTSQDIECTEEPQEPSKSFGLVYGARKVMVTAYQSCSADEKAPIEESTPDVKGIRIVGTHSDGIGKKREISDLRSVQQTNYYLQNLGQSSSCQDVRENPLIYDYGGKPYVTAEERSSLNLFKNMGSGTSVLGIDCSGFVFASVAAGGLKLHPLKKLKAILVTGINSRMYMDPEANGMPCFSKVKMGVSGTLKPGDVVAIPGHVLIIDSIGADPFGIQKISSSEKCASLNYRNFNFNVAQSSPSKNGIGINRFFGPDYLAEEPSIRTGFEKYARDACKARFQKKDLQIVASDFQIIRHQQSGACVDKALPLEGEGCALTCPSLQSLQLDIDSRRAL